MAFYGQKPEIPRHVPTKFPPSAATSSCCSMTKYSEHARATARITNDNNTTTTQCKTPLGLVFLLSSSRITAGEELEEDSPGTVVVQVELCVVIDIAIQLI